MKKQVKKKLVAVLLVGIMVVMNCMTVFAQNMTDVESRDYIDVSAELVAKIIHNGQTYTKELSLTKSDFTSTDVFLTATQGEQNVTFEMDLNNISEEIDSLEKNHILIGGTYPTGTADNPVNYVLTLEKDVMITDENGMEIATIPATFTAKFNYWTETKCFELNVEETEEVPEENTFEEENSEELQTNLPEEDKEEIPLVDNTDQDKIEEQKTELSDESKTEIQDTEATDENKPVEQNNVEESNEEKETAPQNTDVPVIIEPITWNTEDIKTTVTLTGRNLKNEEFVFELVDRDGTIIAEGKNNESGEIVFEAKDISYNKAGEFKYVIREVDNKLGGVTYDTTSHEITVKVSETDGKLSVEIMYPKNGINFNNTYDTENADIVLSGTVYLDGGGRKLEAKEFGFEFLETDENGNALEGASAQKVMNDAEGKFSMKYTYALKNVGTHYYKVTQVTGKESGMAYASNSYFVKVEVKDNGDGTLSILSENNTKLNFTNKYEASGSIAIKAKTKLYGRDLKEGEFQFKVEAVTEGAPMPAKVIATNQKDGTIVFDKITYDEEDIGKTYKYRLSTVKGNLEKMTYEKNTYNVVITITDEGNAKLEMKQSYVPTFYQEYNKRFIPKTGDNTMIPIYGIVALMSGVVVVWGLRKIKKENHV